MIKVQCVRGEAVLVRYDGQQELQNMDAQAAPPQAK